MYLRGHISDSFLLTSHNAKSCKLHLGTSGESLSFKLLTCSLIKIHFDILALQEVGAVAQGTVTDDGFWDRNDPRLQLHDELNDYWVVCTDCLKSHLGQAILIDKSYTDGILGTLKGDRFIGAHLLHKSGTKMWILAGHLPHRQQPIMDYSNAMQELNSLLQRTQHSPCLVAADWNATLSGTTLDAQALQLACLVAESKCQLLMPKEPTWKNKTYDFFLASPLLLQKIDPAASELLTPQVVRGLEALLPTDHKLVAFDTVLCHSRPRPSYRRATRTGKWLVDTAAEGLTDIHLAIPMVRPMPPIAILPIQIAQPKIP